MSRRLVNFLIIYILTQFCSCLGASGIVKNQLECDLKEKFNVLSFDNSQEVYNYCTVDSIVYPKRNLIKIKRVGFLKMEFIEFSQTSRKGTYYFCLDKFSFPQISIHGRDTITSRGHYGQTTFINYSLIRNELDSNTNFVFDRNNAAYKIETFRLKQILK